MQQEKRRRGKPSLEDDIYYLNLELEQLEENLTVNEIKQIKEKSGRLRSHNPSHRPSRYSPKMDKIVKRLTLEMYTLDDIAKELGIHKTTIMYWRKKYDSFNKAFMDGQKGQVHDIAISAAKRAVGYDVEETKEIIDGFGNVRRVEKVKKHILPDVAAIKFMLTNLDPENWKDRREEHVTVNNDKDELADFLSNLKSEENSND